MKGHNLYVFVQVHVMSGCLLVCIRILTVHNPCEYVEWTHMNLC